MTILSATVVKDPLEEQEEPSESTTESEKQYLAAISKMTEAEADRFCEDLQHILKQTHTKCPFQHRGRAQ